MIQGQYKVMSKSLIENKVRFNMENSFIKKDLSQNNFK